MVSEECHIECLHPWLQLIWRQGKMPAIQQVSVRPYTIEGGYDPLATSAKWMRQHIHGRSAPLTVQEINRREREYIIPYSRARLILVS
jgi:hypothetical protein